MTSRRLTPYLMLLPAVTAVMIVLIYPFLANVVLAFWQWDFGDFESAQFVWFENFERLVTRDPFFWGSLRFTFSFTAATIAIELVLGLGIALLLHQLHRGKSVITAIVLIPFIAAPISVGTVWRLLLSDPSPMNYALGMVGVPAIPWLYDPVAAFWAVVLAEVWRSTPFVVLILVAALAAIPAHLLEAAKVDGATTWRRFTLITLPLLRPALTVVLVFLLVFKLRVFDLVVALTTGGPANSTTPLGLLLRQEYFLYQDTGKAAAIGVLLLFLGVITSVISFRLVYREVKY